MENLSSGVQDWDVVYADCAPRVFNYFRYRIGNEVDAAELTSRTFEKAWRSRMTYRKDLSGFTTWLFTIAKNVHVDYLKGMHIYLPIDAAANLAADGSPATDAERTSDLSRLAALCADLSERDRELIALRYGADLSNRFISKVTGLSESNVGTVLHRLVKVLRERW